ncbi:unnamed protein product, partial [Rotaria magnacalcarata]
RQVPLQRQRQLPVRYQKQLRRLVLLRHLLRLPLPPRRQQPRLRQARHRPQRLRLQ